MRQEQDFKIQFQTSLIDAFITKEEEYEQFQQNDEKTYQDEEYWSTIFNVT